MAKDHLGEVDYLRVFALITIVVIHSMGYFFSIPGGNPISHAFQGLAINMLRYGRFVFMFVTGLVFFYSYKDRELKVERFFKRRLKNLVIPYAIWTAVYLLLGSLSNMFSWSNPIGFVTLWLRSLLNGNAFYHLYYIVVTFQFYIFLPLLLSIFKPNRQRFWAGILLGGGFFLCIFYYYFLETKGPQILNLVAGTPWAGITDWMLRYKNHLLFSYLPFYLLGGFFGIHLDVCRKWISEHLSLIGPVLLLSTGIVIGEYFFFYRYLGQTWNLTVSVFKPSIYIYSLSIIAVIFWLSSIMESRGSLKVFIKILSANSLGIYLMHPAILFLLHSLYWNLALPGYLLVILDPVAAIAISCFITLLFGSNKYTRFIIGEAGNTRLQRNLGLFKYLKNVS